MVRYEIIINSAWDDELVTESADLINKNNESQHRTLGKLFSLARSRTCNLQTVQLLKTARKQS